MVGQSPHTSIKLRAQRPQHRVRQLANRTRRMIFRNPLLQ
jgi:hypothetical protein